MLPCLSSFQSGLVGLNDPTGILSRDICRKICTGYLLPRVGKVWIPKVRKLIKMRNANKSEKVSRKSRNCLNMVNTAATMAI